MKGMPNDTIRGPAHSPIPGWVRLALVALGVPNVVTGAWALLAPEHWFDRFPGWDPRLVAGEPPFNAHLATDAGAGFIATGVIVLLAAWLADTRTAQVALLGYAAFAIPHALYHSSNPAPELTSGENLQSVASVVITAVITVGLLLVVRRSDHQPRPAPRPTEVPA